VNGIVRVNNLCHYNVALCFCIHEACNMYLFLLQIQIMKVNLTFEVDCFLTRNNQTCFHLKESVKINVHFGVQFFWTALYLPFHVHTAGKTESVYLMFKCNVYCSVCHVTYDS